MATYQTVYNKIKAALTSRTVGTLVPAALLEEAVIAVLDFNVSNNTEQVNTSPHGAHSNAIAGFPCDLVWNNAFVDTAYDFSPYGYDANGNPVEIIFIAKYADRITVKTLVNATLTATAVAY